MVDIEITQTIDEIICGINAGETAVFCGAGISKNSGLPTVSQFVSYILGTLNMPAVFRKVNMSEEDIQAVLDLNLPFESYLETLVENTHAGNLLDIFGKGEPNTNHMLLAKLAKADKLRTIVTTNFDRLIEKACEQEGLIPGLDFDVIYKEKDFENVDWQKEKIRIIKIHGSIEDKQDMAITLKKVARWISSDPRKYIIDGLFWNGSHTNVLVLGYNSSDVFDLTPQIESINGGRKRVVYNSYSDAEYIKDICEQVDKNPFKQFEGSKRLYYNTDKLVKSIRSSCADGIYEYKSGQTDWKRNVDLWYEENIATRSELMQYYVGGLLLLKMGRFGEALVYLSDLDLETVQVEAGNEDSTLSLRIILLKAKVFIGLGDCPRAIPCSEKAFQLARETADDNAQAEACDLCGRAAFGLGQYQTAVTFFQAALRIAIDKTGDKQVEGETLGNLGRVYEALGDHQKAIAHYERSMAIAAVAGNKQDQADALYYIGCANFNLGNHEKATTHFLAALDIARLIGDKYREGESLIYIGDSSLISHDSAKALDYYERVLKNAKIEHSQKAQMVALDKIASVYNALGEKRKAAQHSEEALVVAESLALMETSDRRKMLGCLESAVNRAKEIGLSYEALGESQKALDLYEKAFRIVQTMILINGHSSGEEGRAKTIEYCYQGLTMAKEIGSRHSKSGAHQKAAESFKQALEDAWISGDKQEIIQLLSLVAAEYTSLKDYKETIRYYKRLREYAEEIGNSGVKGVAIANIGFAYSSLGAHDKAKGYWTKSLKILLPLVGAEDPFIKHINECLRTGKSK